MKYFRPFVAALLGSALAAGAKADEAPPSVAPPAGATISVAPFSAAAPGEPAATWRFATLPNKQPTHFTVVDLAGSRVLKVEADGSYGNLVHDMKVQASERASLAWRWRVDKLIDEADLTSRSGDDSPAKLCVFFAFDAAKLSFGERTRLALAHSVSGEAVPTETLCYVWDNKVAAGTELDNAFTKRIRLIVLRSGGAALGQWVAERRNLGADYRRAFGDESDHLPEITGIAVAADADSTHGHGLAYFGDIELTP